MSEDRLLAALALCRKAGKLAVGFDASIKALAAGAPLAVTASDISPRTLRALTDSRGGERRLPIDRTQMQIETATGRRFVLAAVTDDGLAALVRRCAAQDKEA